MTKEEFEKWARITVNEKEWEKITEVFYRGFNHRWHNNTDEFLEFFVNGLGMEDINELYEVLEKAKQKKKEIATNKRELHRMFVLYGLDSSYSFE